MLMEGQEEEESAQSEQELEEKTKESERMSRDMIRNIQTTQRGFRAVCFSWA